MIPTETRQPTRTAARSLRRVPVPSNFELYSWLFMRVSALLLLFLALGHFAIMHVLNDVSIVNFDFVAARWASFFWRSYDAALLLLALLHGGNGMRVIIDDYVRPPGLRVLAQTLLYLTTGILLVVGTLVLATFQPPES